MLCAPRVSVAQSNLKGTVADSPTRVESANNCTLFMVWPLAFTVALMGTVVGAVKEAPSVGEAMVMLGTRTGAATDTVNERVTMLFCACPSLTVTEMTAVPAALVFGLKLSTPFVAGLE